MDIARSRDTKRRTAHPEGRPGENLGAAHKVLNPLSPVEAMELLIERLAKTQSNGECLAKMSQLESIRPISSARLRR